MKKNGYEETTTMATDQRLKLLARNVNLDDPEEVKDFIAKQSWSPYFKNAVSYAYDEYVKANGLSWKITIYRTHHRLPKIPTTEQVNVIIAETRCLRKALAFSIIRDTGIRPIELHKLTLKHIDLEKGILYPSSAKMGEGRSLKVKSKTLAMLKRYVGTNDFNVSETIFPKPTKMKANFIRARNRLAKKLNDPSIKTVRLYDLRHYFATMLYHKTKDILYVKKMMGHKTLKATLIYTQLVDFRDEFHCRTAKTVEEASKLVEAGFEYVTEMGGVKLFRKRK